MDRKILRGVGLGVVAGVLDVIPMLLQGLSWDANLSAFCLWVVAGFMIATSSLKLKPAFKGGVIAFLILAPSAVLIAWEAPASLLPISLMTLVLGLLLGHLIGE